MTGQEEEKLPQIPLIGFQRVGGKPPLGCQVIQPGPTLFQKIRSCRYEEFVLFHGVGIQFVDGIIYP